MYSPACCLGGTIDELQQLEWWEAARSIQVQSHVLLPKSRYCPTCRPLVDCPDLLGPPGNRLSSDPPQQSLRPGAGNRLVYRGSSGAGALRFVLLCILRLGRLESDRMANKRRMHELCSRTVTAVTRKTLPFCPTLRDLGQEASARE